MFRHADVVCVCLVPVLNAALCMVCCLLMLVKDARGDHMEKAYSRVGHMTTLYVAMGVSMLFAFRDLWKEWGDSIFRSFHRTASYTTGGWSRWNILMCFLYIILSTTVLFLNLKDAILFLQCLIFFVCVHFHFIII